MVIIAIGAVINRMYDDSLGALNCHNSLYNLRQEIALKVKADAGDAVASYQLSFMYSHGQDLDSGKAREYLVKAANLHHPGAEFALALDDFGANTSPDPVHPGEVVIVGRLGEYRDWLRRSAEDGSVSAQASLAQNYLYGRNGFPVDAVEAYKWALISGDPPYRDAPSLAKMVVHTLKMTKAQINTAQREAHLWKVPRYEADLDDNEKDLMGLEWHFGTSCCIYGNTCERARMFQ